jgi:hypothetical protein
MLLICRNCLSFLFVPAAFYAWKINFSSSIHPNETKKNEHRERIRHTCWPHESVSWQNLIPVALCVIATALTGEGSWDCRYFRGATVSFTGEHYGLWSMETIYGQCTTYDVLFFSYRLDRYLKAARFFSMAALLLGLAMTAVLTQALQFHGLSWAVGGALTLPFLLSALGSSTFNIWTIFFIFTYIIFIIISRFLFIHPVHRRISARGNKIIAFHFALCSIYSALTMVVLSSDFCTCRNITAEKLEGREPGSPCGGECTLERAGAVMIAASFVWAVGCGAVLKFGVQPDELKNDQEVTRQFAHYPTQSITTRVFQTGTALRNGAQTLGKQISYPKLLGSPFKQANDSENAENPATCEAEDEENSPNDKVEEAAALQEAIDNRPWRKRICFDYRVTPRSFWEHVRFGVFRTGLGIAVVMYIFIVVMLTGSFHENTQAAKAPSTTYNFVTDVVCAYNPSDPQSAWKSFGTKASALDAGYVVAHCGACGKCSNPYDVRAYVATRKSVAKSAKKCGPKAMLAGYDSLVECLQKRIGFTRPCTECWADNMKTTSKYCVLTCMTSLFTGQLTSNNVKGAGDLGWLNQCLFCDEKRSGPAFVTCSGVARRRLGIASEIERNPEEQCRNVNFDWLTVDWNASFPGTPNSLDRM